MYAAGDPRPIGVFDSGVGGLTVARALRAHLPHESLLYLGDTARVPYGTKSPDVVRRYALNCAALLADRGAKAIVIACNTASAVAVQEVAAALALPVIGVIEPGARMAAAASANGRIGIIGTEGTIRSGRYQALIAAQAPRATILAQACPLFVPLAEEDMARHPVTAAIAREYLAPLLDARIDTLVLGCTHYPVLRETLAEVCGPAVHIIDSASAVAEAAARALEERGLVATPGARTTLRVFATDAPERFVRIARIFFGQAVGEVEWVDVSAGHRSGPAPAALQAAPPPSGSRS